MSVTARSDIVERAPESVKNFKERERVLKHESETPCIVALRANQKKISGLADLRFYPTL
jgi:hypothetical protein